MLGTVAKGEPMTLGSSFGVCVERLMEELA